MDGTVAIEETLAWEARRRPAAAAASGLAAVLIIGSFVVAGAVFADAPRPGVLDALGAAAAPGPVADAQSPRIPLWQLYSDDGTSILASSGLQALGYLLMGLALTFLTFAARARMETMSKVALYAPIVGAVLSALGVLGSTLGLLSGVAEFLDGARTVDASGDVRGGSLVTTAGLVGLAGGAALALGFGLVALNGMRTGLLTRFMGVLGILAAVLTFIPIGSPVPVVQCIWLLALALIFLGRWPSGTPPAWQTGRAEPWPTQQELREQREAARTGGGPDLKKKRSPAPVAVPAGGAERSANSQHPSSRKKKRKRRS